MRTCELTLLTVISLAALAACSSRATSTATPDVDVDAGADAGASPNALRFDTSPYTVQPGEEKRYFCYTMRLPADQNLQVTQIKPTYGKATHHLGVYYTLAPEPDGTFICPELVKETWIPLYGGGVESGTLTVPNGGAFHLLKGQQILVQLHLLNATPQPVTDKANIEFTTTTDANAVPAGMFGMSNTQIKLAPNAAGKVAMDCKVNEQMNVFAVFGHMHQLGTQIKLTKGEDVLFAENWNFNDQPTVPKTLQLNAGDPLHLECEYNNTTGGTISYGESTNTEMCAFVLYYTPYQHLDGCQQ